jgi:hypothetical protein
VGSRATSGHATGEREPGDLSCKKEKLGNENGRSVGKRLAIDPNDNSPQQPRFWPLNLDLGGVKLVYASAQPICQLNDANTRYTGDVIRAYHADKLLTDGFYHARPFEIGLRRYGSAVYKDGLALKILPLREDAPIYLGDRSKLKFDDNHTALTLESVEVIETHDVRMVAGR